MNIYLQETFISGTQFNAGSKARNDCDCILERLGYKPYRLFVCKSRILHQFMRVYNLLLLPFRLRKVDTCFLQYPYYSYLRFHSFLYKWIFWNCKGNVICLIHDILAYREQKNIEKTLSFVLQKSNKVIVHTPAMKELLKDKLGLPSDKIGILYLFDYLTESPMQSVNPVGKNIIFAGNLSKSKFLRDLGKLAGMSISFHLYGVYSDNVVETSNCIYRGRFQPDDVAAIEGDWGLVWDGDSLDTCSGNYGEYLKVNSSHKISLYLSAGKPVIIWEESSLRDFIVSNHLGISISSLYEIPGILDALSEVEVKSIQENVLAYAKKLRKGYFLKKCLDE